MTIPLIDKQDTFEIVDLQIAAILAQATIDQQALATAAAKDPDLWTFDVFSEKFNPIELFQNDDQAFPVVNVWYDTSNFNPKDGDPVRKQMDSAVYNIDIYAAEPASDNPGGGYYPVDQTTVSTLHRIIRLVRNIIMHPDNTYLQLYEMVGSKKKNIVGKRWVQSKEVFQPQIGDRPVQGVIACRIPLNVTFNETPVQESFDTIELVSIEVSRAEDGKIILEADFDTT
jgi:hypothetical protein